MLDRTIINKDEVRRSISPLFNSQNLISADLNVPTENKNLCVAVSDINELFKNIISAASDMPHNSFFLTYKINSESSISLNIYPKVESA